MRCGSRPKRWKTIAILLAAEALELADRERRARRRRRSTIAPVGRIDQPVEMADQRRLAGAGQAHDDEDLAALDRDRDVVEAEHVARSRRAARPWSRRRGRRASAFFGVGPKILVRCAASIRAKRQFLTRAVGLQPAAEGLADAVEDDGEDDDGEAADEAGAGVVPLQADQHRLADAAGADHRGDDHHRQRHHRWSG